MNFRILSLISTSLSLLLLCNCSSMNYKKTLSDKEQKDLIQFAQGIISKMPDDKLSKADKSYIMTHDPKSKIVYRGYKIGKVTLEWEFPNKNKVQYRADGEIMDFQKSFRGISFFNMNIKKNYIRRK